ncbi:MAG: DoxX family membrane protein, partial [Bacteroidales bacterium]
METRKSKPVVKILITILRVSLGWFFLYEGMTKVSDPGWTSYNYLSNTSGFLAGFYHALAANPFVLRIVDLLNVWGLVLIGLALFVGLFVKFAAMAGTL